MGKLKVMKKALPESYNSTKEMSEHLNLTGEQRQSISLINKRYDGALNSSNVQDMRILQRLQHKKELQQARNKAT